MTVKGTGIYFPEREAEVLGYYENAVTVLATLATKYGIDAATLTNLQTHNTNMHTSNQQAIADAGAAQNSTRIKKAEFVSGKAALLLLFKQIQLSPAFDEGDAELLGFRVVTDPVDLKTVKPVISGVTVDEEVVIIDWIKGRMQGVIIYGSYDGKNFKEIGRDMRSPFEDTRKNLTDQPEERYYRMKYMKDDKAIGLTTAIEKVIVSIFQVQ